MQTYKPVITEKNIKKYGLPKDWSLTEFTYHNPTPTPFSFNLFQQNNVANYPTTPSATIYPATLNNIANGASTASIAWNSISNRIYMYNDTVGAIEVINPISFAVEASIPAVGTGISRGMSFSPIDNRIIFLAPALNQYWVIDCASNTVINTFPLVAPPRFMTYNSIKNSFYVTTQTLLIEISSATQLIVFSTVLGGNLTDLAFVNSKNDVYVADLLLGVFDFDCTTNTVVGLPIVVSNQAKAVEYCSVKDTVYIGKNGAGFIEEIDVVTNTLLATNIPKTNLSLLYIPYANVLYGNDGVFFYIIDCTTNTIITTYPLSGGTLEFALDPIDNRVFCSGFGVGQYYVFTPLLQFYITGSDNYNEWVQSTFNDPMTVRRVQYISQNSNNFNQVLQKTTKNANGNEVFIPLIPELSVCINMYQSGMAQMEFFAGHLTLGKGGDYFSGFTVDAFSETKMLIYYKQVDGGAQLSSSRNRETVFDKLDFPHKDPKSWSEEELEAPQIPVMHPMPFNEWVKFEREIAKKPRVKKIISRPLEEEIIEFETKVYGGQAIIEDPSKLEFKTTQRDYVPVKRKLDKLEYEDIEYRTKVYGSQAIIEDASHTEFQVVEPKYTPTQIRKMKELEYEDIEYTTEEYGGQAIVPFGSGVEYEQIEMQEDAVKSRQDEMYYEDIEVETEVYGGQAIVEEPCNVIIVVAGDEKSDALIQRLKDSNKKRFGHTGKRNY